MISAEQNRRLTEVGPGTPGGALLRHYWQPVALSEELDALQDGVSRPVIPVRALGQDFVLFRDARGKPALLDRDCPHRGADLSYGRLESDGLRCPFHGWLFDGAGRCLQTPGEPAGSRLCERVTQKSWPVLERSGVIFAWLKEPIGAASSGSKGCEPASLPALDCFAAPATHTFAFKGLWACNWLQAMEVGIDPAHASFLHRFFEDADAADAYGQQFRSKSADSDLPMTRVMREFDSPQINIEPTEFGMRLVTLRALPGEATHVRVTNQVFPQAFVLPMSETMTITQWHMPVDDTHCYWVAIFTSFAGPVDHTLMREQRLAQHELPAYLSRLNRSNRYGFNAAEQQSQTFTGMGFDINVHDQWAVESPGAIQDRTREHLGTTDKAIMANRRQLLRAMDAVERGENPPGVFDASQAVRITGPATVDGVCPGSDPTAIAQYWRDADAVRRNGASWITEANDAAGQPRTGARQQDGAGDSTQSGAGLVTVTGSATGAK